MRKIIFFLILTISFASCKTHKIKSSNPDYKPLESFGTDTLAFYKLKSNIKYETIIDTLKISKEVEQHLGIYETGEGTHTIDAVCRRFALKDKKHHFALDDAEMAGNLILAFKHALETGKIEPIEIPEKIGTPKETNVENSMEEKQDNTSPNEGGLFSFFKRIFR